MKGWDDDDELETYGDGLYFYPEDEEPKRTWGKSAWHWWVTLAIALILWAIVWKYS